MHLQGAKEPVNNSSLIQFYTCCYITDSRLVYTALRHFSVFFFSVLKM